MKQAQPSMTPLMRDSEKDVVALRTISKHSVRQADDRPTPLETVKISEVRALSYAWPTRLGVAFTLHFIRFILLF